MTNDKHNRIFWLGLHVVLTKTELPRLRAMGYEVFNPPYLADIYDQSAVTQWDRDQQTTLPPEVFEELSRYSFFYNRISPRIAELLNEHFGTVIVTCAPMWLYSMLGAFRGRIIYRTFGQTCLQSDALFDMQLFRSIQEQDDFHFVPHSSDCVRDEHAWLKSRMTVVPYTIPLDVFDHEGTWAPSAPNAQEIMTCCPNIENPYYVHQYHYLNTFFPEPYIKLYGVQPRGQSDPRVVGTLERNELLNCYRRSAGYWYHYDAPYVCYLPPIEMMTIGGPVVYMRGSLLAYGLPARGPGEAANIDDAKRKLALLLAGDRTFIDEVRAAQAPMARTYHPDYVQPIFDRTFRHLIDRPEAPPQEPVILSAGPPTSPQKRVYVFFHAPGQHATMRDGQYEPVDDLGRTVADTVNALLEETDHEVVVTCVFEQLQLAYGLLRADQFPGRLRLYVLDHRRLAPVSFKTFEAPMLPWRKQAVDAPAQPPHGAIASHGVAAGPAPPANWRSRLAYRARRLGVASLAMVWKSRALLWIVLVMSRAAIRSLRFARRERTRLIALKLRLRAWLGRRWRALRTPDPWMGRRDCVDRVNAESGDVVVVVPLGFPFPEALLVNKPIVLCVPDDTSAASAPAGGLRKKINTMIGRCLLEKGATVVASSEIAQSPLFAEKLSIRPRGHRAAHRDLAIGAGSKR